MAYLHEQLTGSVIEAYYAVYNGLGYGFLENVYEVAMMVELGERRLNAQRQCPIKVQYHQQIIGNYRADIIVEGRILLEIKAAEHLAMEHECQLINYLRATDLEVGLLLNFGRNPAVRRKIYTNDRKQLIPLPSLQTKKREH